MTELIRKKLNDSPIARWTAMFIVSFTMMCGYFITDVMASLEVMCTTPVATAVWVGAARSTASSRAHTVISMFSC